MTSLKEQKLASMRSNLLTQEQREEEWRRRLREAEQLVEKCWQELIAAAAELRRTHARYEHLLAHTPDAYHDPAVQQAGDAVGQADRTARAAGLAWVQARKAQGKCCTSIGDAKRAYSRQVKRMTKLEQQKGQP